MTLLYQTILNHLPLKARTNSTGWRQFNAPCCHHRGHSQDTRGRGNLKVDSGGIVFNCYNCAFKFKFDGASMSKNLENFLGWINVDREIVQKIKMELFAASVNDDTRAKKIERMFQPQAWPRVDLPEGSRNILAIMDSGELPEDENFLKVVEYLGTRGTAIVEGSDYYWSPALKDQMNRRLIVPFESNGKIVGYTGRLIGHPPKGVAKYYNSAIPTGFLFNDAVAKIEDRKFLTVVEGPFDAIAVQGVAALGATLSEAQIQWLTSQDREIVVLPDREAKNQTLIDTALTFGWSVSFPDWERHIKDAAEACLRYGQVYTITSVLKSRTADPVEIGVRRQMLGK